MSGGVRRRAGPKPKRLADPPAACPPPERVRKREVGPGGGKPKKAGGCNTGFGQEETLVDCRGHSQRSGRYAGICTGAGT
jgi:hypothetical protein